MAGSRGKSKNGQPLGRHRVREKIEQMILNGEPQPGHRLLQQHLAKKFGVAQGIVREALLELQAYGLVEAVDNRGVFVSQLNADKLLESFDVREVLEGLAVRLCCEHTSRSDVRELMDLAQEIHALAEQKKFDRMASLDREMHQRLIQLSGNSMLVRLCENCHALGKTVRTERDPTQVRDEHIAILQAIDERRADDAERLIREHIRTGRNALQKAMKDGVFVPKWVR
jgi:DNA-binding GntR family transcriptional regulator